MGSGCSSPLKRFGGKRGKMRRDSSIYGDVNGDKNDNQDTIASRQQQQQQQQATKQAAGEQQDQQQRQQQKHKFMIENEITIQSEINDDHPSTASYYTDGKNHSEETRPEAGGKLTAKQESSAATGTNTTSTTTASNLNAFSRGAAARAMGLDSAYVPIDRHLLVSPALSPAPSTCHSPSPASSSTHECANMLDLYELNEAFKILTFGLPANKQDQQQITSTTTTRTNRIRPPSEGQHQPQHQQQRHYNYIQQLIQTPNDLIRYISVIFITTDSNRINDTSALTSRPGDSLECSVASKLESSLKIFCDEQSFSLRFLNLSHEHLSKSFCVTNLADVSMKLLEKEYQENGQRLVIVALSNNWANSSSEMQNPTSPAIPSSGDSAGLDKRQLPSKVEAQVMNKLCNIDLSKHSNEYLNSVDQKFKEALSRWYTQVGSVYYLNPIYLVHPKSLSGSPEDHKEAWQNWLRDSGLIMGVISHLKQETHIAGSEVAEFKLKYLHTMQLDFILNDSNLQKRTLLIRNYSSSASLSVGNNGGGSGSSNNLATNSPNSPQQLQPQQAQPNLHQQSSLRHHNKDASLNDLVKLLADPNKLTLKRPMKDEEVIKTINDWIIENLNKFLESIQEYQIINGKHVPPFVERSLFTELTCQRMKLEYYLDNITENYESKCRNFYTNQIAPLLSGFMDPNSEAAIDESTASTTTSATTPDDDLKQPSTSHLVFISGPRGCGKSTLFAQLIRFTAEQLYHKAQIIYRFCGTSLDSIKPNRLLRSICEQFCQTQGENITAASYIYSNQRSEILDALNKIIKVQHSLIFLDAIDRFSEQSASKGTSSPSSSLDWLCQIEANPRVKIFVILETDSELYKKVLSCYSDATHISVDYPTFSEWAQMLASTARSKRLNSSGNLYDEIKNLNVLSSSATATPTSPQLKNVMDNLTYNDVNDIISMCRLRRLNNEYIYPELNCKTLQQQSNINRSLKQIQIEVLKHLHHLISPYQLCAFLVAIQSSRNGLSEMDIINIMALISSKSGASQSSASESLSSSSSSPQASRKFSATLFNYLKIQLQPWLVRLVCDRVVKLTVQEDFIKTALDYYVPTIFKNIVTEVRDVSLEYFSAQIRPSKSSSILSAISGGSVGGGAGSGGSNPIEPKDNPTNSQALWLATQTSETMNLLILTNPSKAREYIMNKHQFFLQFFYNSMPEEFIEDYERLRDLSGRKASYSEELQCLVDYIRQSVYPLRYNGSQVYSQIYCRTYETSKSGKFPKSKKFNDILTTAACPPVRNLLPLSENSVNSFIKARIGQNQASITATSVASTATSATTNLTATSGQATKPQQQPASKPPTGSCYPSQRIYPIRDNHRHVIVIYPDRGILSVWDIYEERAVRIINNIDQPRDLRMIDQKRAVVLCNRELRVYDLDSGDMLTRLKGVMNQKMPFFEVFGENYVVALARNRMYVNMLNLNTGELETTFKVGEDRFLNSLLVSANGGICVCGDETQKPFPLLVWNLNERRLMYDLRLDRHEFITRMSAISDDGHFVVSVCRQLGEASDNLPHSGTPTTLTSGLSSVSSFSSASAGGKSKSSSPNFIVIYDLNSGTLFKKWKPGLDTCAVAISLPPNKSGKVINTIVDSSILVWDLATGSKRHTLVGHTSPADVIQIQNNRLFSMDSTCRDQSLRMWDIEEGYCLAVFSPDAPVNCGQISTRGDALVCGFVSDMRLSTLVLCKNETVNEILKKNKRRKSSRSLYIFDEPPGRKSSS